MMITTKIARILSPTEMTHCALSPFYRSLHRRNAGYIPSMLLIINIDFHESIAIFSGKTLFTSDGPIQFPHTNDPAAA
jgi:hypothetical protein